MEPGRAGRALTTPLEETTGPRSWLGWQQLFLALTSSLGNKSLLLTSFLYLAENGAGAVGLNSFFLFNLAPSYFLLLKKEF